ERSLVGIGPEEVWNVRIPAGVEERSGLIGKKSAIDHRSEVSLREVRQERARRKLSEAAQLIGRAAATDRGCERLGGRVTFRRRRLTRRASAAPGGGGWVPPPLSPIPRRNSRRGAPAAICKHTSSEPADSPKIVTFLGLPPNAMMLARTHSSAARWSSKP